MSSIGSPFRCSSLHCRCLFRLRTTFASAGWRSERVRLRVRSPFLRRVDGALTNQETMAAVTYFDNGDFDIGHFDASEMSVDTESKRIVPVAFRRCMALMRARRPLLARELVAAIILPRTFTVHSRSIFDGVLLRQQSAVVDLHRHGIDRSFREDRHPAMSTSLRYERVYVMGSSDGFIQHWKPTGERGHRFKWRTRCGWRRCRKPAIV